MAGIASSDSGAFIYALGTTSEEPVSASPKRTLVWVDRKGQEEPLDAPPNAYL